MPNTSPPSPVIRLTVIVGAILVVVGAIWLLVLATSSPDPIATADRSAASPVAAAATAEAIHDPTVAEATLEPQTVVAEATAEPQTVVAEATAEPQTVVAEATAEPDEWTEFTLVMLDDSDLGTGSVEFSAVTLNEDRNRLVIAEDGDRLFEFDLAVSGEPITPPRRTIAVEIGAGDVEGLAWISASTFVIAHENDGRLTVVEIADDATSVGPSDLVQTIDTGIREDDGSGLEGVAVRSGNGAASFAVIDERPPTLQLLNNDGETEQVMSLDLGVADVSDLWAIGERAFLVLSDEGRQVLLLDIGNDGIVNHRSVLDLSFAEGRFEQPEGIVASRDGKRLYVVGEGPGPGRFSFGLWLIA